MGKLTQVRAAAGRGAAWLLPAGRRDWLAALWAEAHEVPPGSTAAMAVTTLGTGTTILMLKSPWLLHWLNHGRHLTAFATYRYELNTTNHTGAYVLMLMFFPVIGLITSYLAAVIANPAPPNARSPSPGLPMTSGE